ncbi:GNAT family N-acetyltransferase [Cohnella zeiphila]|uniref:GNAT family N-acetyltransferase n=1 Tax=Cohnella zeiphila TaxID=2761120 RepID=A0A7X0VXV2_9BACL|nr:GNAT family N-acetyltransferase [Cohnella zeiphila]MBB6733852.1 GNAT family N-acetyltransferase [Cohnella zeiphila]
MLKLRPNRPDDDPFLYELYASTRMEEISMWGWDGQTAQAFLRMQWTAQMHSYSMQYPDLHHRMVLADETLAGRILTSSREDELVLVDISLLPSFRGRGIGGELIERLQEEAAESGRFIKLHVLKENASAIRLYERLGFATVADQGMHWEMRWQDRKEPAPKAR